MNIQSTQLTHKKLNAEIALLIGIVVLLFTYKTATKKTITQ